MLTLAVDPGSKISGYILYSNGKLLESGVAENEKFSNFNCDTLLIEKPEARNAPLGKSLLETIYFAGQLEGYFRALDADVFAYKPSTIRTALVGRPNATDKNVRDYLLEYYDLKKLKITSHAIQALALYHFYQNFMDVSRNVA
jgi:Holliday junction resolvasome RuvABC endonuclease subunit